MKDKSIVLLSIMVLIVFGGCTEAKLPDVGSAPTAEAGDDIVVETGTRATLYGDGSSDVDSSELYFDWSFSSIPSNSELTSFDILGAATSFAGFTPDVDGEYIIVLKVSDGEHEVSDNVKVTAITTSPTAEAGNNRSVVIDTTVSLDGSGSFDPDGDSLSYSWDVVSVPDGSSFNSNDIQNAATAFPEFTPEDLGIYIFKLTVSDGTNAATDTITINVLVTIHPPVADAGTDQICETNYSVSLDGTQSFDTDGDELYFVWSFNEVPDESFLSDSNISGADAASASFIPDVDGDYQVNLSVNDGCIIINDTVTITAQTGYMRPTAVAGSDIVLETGYTVTGLSGEDSFDPNGDALNFLWSLIGNPAGSGITNNDLSDRHSVEVGFVPDLDGDYILELEVSDGYYHHTDTVTITAASHVYKPIADAGDNITTDYGVSVNLDGSGSYDPNGDNLTYNWIVISRPAGSIAEIIDSETVNPSFIPDVIGEYEIECTVSDGYYIHTDEMLITTTPIYLTGDRQIITAGSIDIPMRYVSGGYVFPIGIGDEETYGSNNPESDDYLEGYWVAETEATSALVVEVLNWALVNDKMDDATLTGVYLIIDGQELVSMDQEDCLVDYNGSSFVLRDIAVPNQDIVEYDAGNADFATELEEYKNGASQSPIDVANYPFTGLTWYGAIMICNWLTEMVGLDDDEVVYSHPDDSWSYEETIVDYSKKGFRLPESMEWECAARYIGTEQPSEGEYQYEGGNYWTGGLCPSGGFYAVADYKDGNAPSYPNPVLDVGWYIINAHETDINGNSSNHLVFHGEGGERDADGYLESENIGGAAIGTMEVATKQPNALGLYDMTGNVWEFCYTFEYDESGALTGNVIRRGGAFASHYFFMRVGRELDTSPRSSNYLHGFRLFMSE